MNPYAALRETLGRPMFIPFAVLGDGGVEASKRVLQTYLDNGADALEVGMPFSDPTADGPIIQAADKRALDAGVTINDCFAILKAANTHRPVPTGMLVYCNIVLKRGIEKFYADCATSGVTSVLVADLPIEHAGEAMKAAKKHAVAPVFMVSDDTPDERLQRVCKAGGGYIYLVSYLGVTGRTEEIDTKKLRKLIARCREHTDLPLCVGFGIHTPQQVKAVTEAGADGVIVGSCLVKEMPDLIRIGKSCRSLRSAISLLQ